MEDDIINHKDMEGKEPLEQAKLALSEVLNVARGNPCFAWYFGPGTQAWSLCTEAAATLFNRPVAEVRKRLRNPNPRNPAAAK